MRKRRPDAASRLSNVSFVSVADGGSAGNGALHVISHDARFLNAIGIERAVALTDIKEDTATPDLG